MSSLSVQLIALVELYTLKLGSIDGTNKNFESLATICVQTLVAGNIIFSITILSPLVAVGVGVGVSVFVGVGVIVLVGVIVGVTVGVLVCVGVGVIGGENVPKI